MNTQDLKFPRRSSVLRSAPSKIAAAVRGAFSPQRIVKKKAAAPTAADTAKLRFESLEPRLLMSADLIPVPDAAAQDKLQPAAADGIAALGGGGPQIDLLGSLETAALTVSSPMAGLAPAGSLIYEEGISGQFDAPGATDSFTVNLDAGQTISFGFGQVDPSLRGRLEVAAPDSTVIASADAESPGAPVVLQNLQAASAGTYTFSFQNLEGQGAYQGAVLLNAQYETEAYGGLSNNDLLTAVSLDATAFALPNGGSRLAVVGRTDAADPSGPSSLPDFYSFHLDAGQASDVVLTHTSAAAGSQGLRLELRDGAGNLVALSEANAQNVDAAVRGFVPASGGTYYARVVGDPNVDYSLVVTRGAAFDLEPNSQSAEAQDIGFNQTVLGSVGQNFGQGNGDVRIAVVGSETDGSGQDDNYGFYRIVDQLNDSVAFSLTASLVRPSQIDTLAELSQYDAVVIGDNEYWVGTDYDVFAGALRNWVEGQGGGVVMVGWGVAASNYGNVSPQTRSDLDAILPANLFAGFDYQYNATLMPNGVAHPVTEGIGSFAVFPYTEYAYSADPEATVLGTTSGYATVAVRDAGSGRGVNLGPSYAAYSGENTSGLRSGDADRLLEQAVAWAAHGGNDVQDQYLVHVNAGDNLSIATATPGGGADLPANDLDPLLELYAPDGTLVASNNNGGIDGRNALINHIADQTGSYRVRVMPVVGTGDYTLSVVGANGGSASPLTVTGSGIAEGALLTGFPADLYLDFSSPLNFSTLAAGDVTLNGVIVTDFSAVDADTIRLGIGAVSTGDGAYTVSIAAGALTNLQNTGNTAYALNFSLDASAPQVTASSVAEGEKIDQGSPVFDINFSEGMDNLVMDGSDVELVEAFSGAVFAPTYLNYDGGANHLAVGFGSLADGLYTLRLRSGANAFRDIAGNALDGDFNGTPGGDFLRSFYVDSFGPVAYPALDAKAPAGSLIFDPVVRSTLYENYSGSVQEDVDTYVLDLDANQKLGVAVFPVDPGLRARLEVLDPNGFLIGNYDAAAPGQLAALNNLTAALAGQYTIQVTGLDTSTGRFDLRVMLNAAVEEEYLGGAGNDSIEFAQNIDDSFIDLDGSGASRGAVVGNLSASVVVAASSNGVSGIDFSNELSLLSDGVVPPESTDWAAPSNVFWDFQEGSLYFEFDLGDVVSVNDLLMSADNNDWYGVDYSTDGFSWNRLATLDAGVGNVDYGMETFSTLGADPSYEATLDFAPTQARYLRVYADGGDGAYALGEFQIYTDNNSDWYSFTLNDAESATVALRHFDPAQSANARLEVYNPAGERWALGSPGAGNIDQLVAGLKAEGAGTYYARVSGAAAGDYSLTVTRNLDFGTEAGGPQELLSGKALGALQVEEPNDAYLVHVADGDDLTVYTATPGGDAGQPVNDLNPRIDLYDPFGNWVASDDDGWGDGRNAWLSLAGLAAGDYTVVVSSQDGSSGDYLLTVEGATGSRPPFSVTQASLADNAIVPDNPGTLTLDFSAPLRLDHVDNWDLFIEKPDGTGVISDWVSIVDADTLVFDLGAAGLEQGQYTLILGGATLFDIAGREVQNFTTHFFIDTAPPTVSTVSVAEGSVVSTGNISIDVTFSEAIDAAVLDAGDVVLTNTTTGEGFNATAIAYDGGTNTASISFAGLTEGSYTLTLLSGTSSFRDLGGTPLDGDNDGAAGGDFVLNFGADAVSTAYPVPLAAKVPDGGLIYDPSATGYFHGVGDTDGYTLSLDAGQTLTVELTPIDAGIQGSIAVVGPDGSTVLANLSAASAGETLILQTVPVSAAGTYRIDAGSLAGTGRYQVRVVLNAAQEQGANDTQGTAQNLDSSFIGLAGTASRGAVRGAIQATDDVDWYSFSLNAGQRGTITLTNDNRSQPNALNLDLYDAAGHLLATGITGSTDIDRIIKGFAPTAADTFYVRVSGATASYSLLLLREADFDLEPNTLPTQAQALTLDATGNAQALGYLGSYAAAITTETEPNDVAGSGGSSADLPLANDLNGSFLALGGNQYQATVNGVISAGSDVDWDFFKLTLSPGDVVDIYLNGVSGGDPYLRVFNRDGLQITADDDSGSGVNSYLHFTNISYAGDYYLVADAYSSGTLPGGYQLIATVTTPTPHFGDSGDQYLYKANVGDTLVIETLTPGGDGNEPENLLDPQLILYAPDGSQVALNQNGAADARNARIEYMTLTSGDYRIEIRAEGQTHGSYVLRASGSSVQPAPFAVTGTNPSDGALLGGFPETYTVDFSEALLLSSIDAADLTVNGVAAAGVSLVDADTLSFNIANTSGGDGLYAVQIAEGALTSLSGKPLQAFAATFDSDLTAPRVVASSLSGGETLAPGSLSYTASFSEVLATAGLGADDVVLTNLDSGQVISFTADPVYDTATSTLTATFSALPEGNYRLSLVADADGFRDRRDNLLDGEHTGGLPSGDGSAGGDFSVTFRVDAAAATPLAALQGVAPAGSLVYDPPATGNLYGAGDVDEYTVTLDKGQKATVRLTPQSAGLQARVELIGPDGVTVLASADASGPGQTVLLQNIPIADLPIDQAGTYTVRLTSLAGAGDYQTQVVLNAQLEGEDWGGAANNGLAQAESLEDSSHALQGTADRLAALGTVAAGTSDWYSFALAAGQAASAVVTRTDITGGSGLSLELYDAAGILQAYGIADPSNVDQSISGFLAPAAGNYFLRVSAASSLPYSVVVTRGADFGLENSTGTAVQDISLTHQVLGALGNLGGGSVGGVRVAVVDSSGGSNDQGLQAIVNQLNDHTYYAFNASLVPPASADTLAELQQFDVVIIGGTGHESNQFASFASALRGYVENGGGLVTTGWGIYAAGGLTETTRTDFDALVPVNTGGSYTYTSGATVTPTGTSPIVTGVGNFTVGGYTEYAAGSPRVDADAVTLATAEAMPVAASKEFGAGRSVYLGPIYAGSNSFSTSDLRSGNADRLLEQAVAWAAGDRSDSYAFEATAGASLDIRTSTPGDGSGEPVNAPDVRLELYDPTGNLVGSDDNGGGDGRNARILHTALASGRYEVRVINANANGTVSRGDYILQVNGATVGGAAPSVVASSPAEGVNFIAPPTSIALTFSEALLAGSVQASDLTVDNGGSVTNVQFVDGRTLLFSVSLPNTSGAFHYSLATGAVSDLQGAGNDAFSGSFTVDHTGPRVVGQTPALQGSAPFSQISFTFSEAINPASVSTADIQSFTGPGGTSLLGQITGVSVSGNILTVSFNAQNTQGAYSMVLGPNITDLVGNAMDQNQDGSNGQGNDAYTAGIDLQSPDLRAVSLTNSASANWGESVNVTWQVSNIGSDPALENWTDAIYLSTDTSLDASDLLVYSQAAGANPLAATGAYTRNATFNLPLGNNPLVGNYYLLMKTDYSGNQPESREDNNVALGEAIHVGMPAKPDAVVTNIAAPADVILNTSGYTVVPFSWTVTNQGTAPMTNWHDYVWLSPDSTAGVNDVWVGSFEFIGTLNPGESVTRTQNLSLPYNQQGDRWLVVQTDATNQHYEINTANPPSHPNAELNTWVDDQKFQVIFPALPNLQVASITPPASPYSGQDTVVRWTVSNVGTGATSSPTWYDFVYLSQDNVLDANDTFLASVLNPSYLAAGGDYSSQAQVTLPRGISGDYYFLVKTDYYNHVFEDQAEGDNVTASARTTITLTAPPDLQVTSVSAPGGFSGQAMNITWTVQNLGDGATQETSWNDRVYMSADDVLDGGDIILGTWGHSGRLDAYRVTNPPLEPSDYSYTRTEQVTLPIGLPADGVARDYHFFVVTDVNNQVYEFSSQHEANNSRSDPGLVRLTPPPDLEPEPFTIQADAQAGHTLSFDYSVTNWGATPTPGAQSYWIDRFWLSADNVLDANDLYIGDRGHSGVLDVGASYGGTFNYTLPNGLTGDYHVILRTDFDNRLFEGLDSPPSYLPESNNTKVSDNTVHVVSNPADLVVDAFTSSPSGVAGQQINVSWTVRNAGLGDTVASVWTDQIIVSTDGVLGNADDVSLGYFGHSGKLDPGWTYTASSLVSLPYTLASGEYTLFVRADVHDQVYESDSANNSDNNPLTVVRDTADLRAVSVSAPADATAGGSLAVSWRVENRGVSTTNSNYWYDGVWLSADATLDGSDRYLGRVLRSNPLASGQYYDVSASFGLPFDLAAGAWHVIVSADRENNVLEDPSESNNAFATVGTVNIAAWSENSGIPKPSEFLRPDLVVTNVDAPPEGFSGQPFNLTWTVQNQSTDPTPNRQWHDAVYLSRDQFFDRSTDLYIGYQYHNGGLAAGGTYTASGDFTIPTGQTGPFYVFVVADSGNAITESNDANNFTKDNSILDVGLAPPANLVAGTLTLPTNGVPGQTASINYSVTNEAGGNNVTGTWKDTLYLSKDQTWDINDAVFGSNWISYYSGSPLTPGSSYSRTVTATLPGLDPGDYYVIVRSDILNQVQETSESDNLSASLNQVNLDAEQLPLNGSVTGSLGQGQAVYYRLEVGAGETVRINLDSANDFSANELYVSYGGMPSRGHYDFSSQESFSADPSVVIPETQAGTYYILAYGASVSGAPAFTVSAATVPFSITEVATTTINNNANSTLRIRGAKFAEATVFALAAPDGTVYQAQNVFLQDSSEAYVTFGLLSAPVGLYDLVAVQLDGTYAMMNDAITVESDGPGADVWASIGGPAQVPVNRVNVFNLQYSNDGDGDSRAPLLLMRSPSNTPLGFNAADLRSTPIQIIGASLDGLMDVLRPGAQYSQQVLFRSPNDNASLDIQVSVITTDDGRVITDAEWADIKAAVRPVGVADADWDAWWARFQPAVGTTWGSYVTVLNRMLVNLSEPGHPIRDVRDLFARQMAEEPTWLPSVSISGTLVNASDNTPLANVQVTAYRYDTRAGQMVLGGVATTDASGGFSLAGLEDGLYDIYLATDFQFDMDRNGVADNYAPVLTLDGSSDRNGLEFFALPVAPEQPYSPQDSDPQLLLDSAGVAHIIWNRGGQIFHSWNDGSGWVDAQSVYAGAGASGIPGGTGASGVSAAVGGNLIDGSNLGLIVTWTEGDGNAAEIWYAVGRPAAAGGYEWSNPIRLTNDTVSDNAPAVAINGAGQAVITYVKSNAEIQDDTDVYYSVVDVVSGALVFTVAADGSVVEVGAAGLAELDPQGQSVEIPFWSKDFDSPDIFGFRASAKVQLAGTISQDGCEATAGLQGKGSIELRIPEVGRASGELGGALNAYWTVDTSKYPNCDWLFKQAQLDASGSAKLIWKDGVYKALSFFPVTAPAATALRQAQNWVNRYTSLRIENGIIVGPVGFEAKNLRWTKVPPLPGFVMPDSVDSLAVSFSMGIYGGITQRGVSDTGLTVTGSIGGKANIIRSNPGDPLLQFIYEVSIEGKWHNWDLFSYKLNGSYPSEADLLQPFADPIQGQELYVSFNPDGAIGTGNDYGDSVLADVGNDLWKDSAMVMGVDSGTVFGVWSKDEDPMGTDIGSRLYVSDFDGGAWTAAEVVPGSLGANNAAAVAVDGAGNRVLVWSLADVSGLTDASTADDILAARSGSDLFYSIDNGSGWSTAQRLATTNGMDRDTTITREADGDLVMAWTYYDETGGTDVLMSSTWDGSAWTSPVQVASGFVSAPNVGVVGGVTTLFWNVDTDAASDINNFVLQFATLDGSGAWSAPQSFAPVFAATAMAAAEASIPPSSTPITTESLFPPFAVPEDCCKCPPEKIKKITESAPDCKPGGGSQTTFDPKACIEKTINYKPCAVRPRDPNDILGPTGFGEENFIKASDTLAYTIRFENAHDATAPAQQVVITQTFDPDLDPRTFRVNDFGWSDFQQELNADKAFYSGRLDFTATKGYYVDVAVNIDVAASTATWTLTTIDPATGEQPADASIGFLPVNDTVYDPNDHSVVVAGTNRGEGFVSYTIKAKSARPTGTLVDAQASIVFDTQEPIDTPAIFHTMDAVAPESQVAALPANLTPDANGSVDFTVSWGGSDDVSGSAIRDFDIWVSQDGGSFSLWLASTTLAESTYTGQAGHSYAFYSTARDNAGNVEAAPATYDALTTVGAGTQGNIHGFVYLDLDGGGTYNPQTWNAETPIAGRTVFLDANSNGVLDDGEASIASGADGSYAFNGLDAGTYQVAQVLPAGWLLTTPAAGSYSVVVGAGQTISGRDFGNFQTASISGVKFNDLDADGTRDAGEDPLAGWTIFLDANANNTLDAGEQSMVTGIDGAFSFTDIGPGTVQIGEVAQAGWQRTTPAVPYPVTSGMIVAADLGNVQLGSLSGLKFNDLNGDGVRDAGEAGIEGWTIFLDANINGTLDAGEVFTLTAADGSYTFANLLPGQYTVAEEQRTGWVQTTPLPSAGSVNVNTAGSNILMESLGCACGGTWTTTTTTTVPQTGTSASGTGTTSTIDYGAVAINTALETVGISSLRTQPGYANLDGRGVSTVVIDTGIDLNHPFFGSDMNGDGVDDRIIYQYDFANNDANASDVNGHGSHVASLIGSQDAVYTGVAPGTDIIALKVFEDSGRGYFGYLEKALQWVIDNHDAYHVGVVNLSLGDGGNWTDELSRYGLGDEFAALAQMDVIVIAAAGNNYLQFGSMGVAYPASDPAVISVGATWAADFGGPWTVSTGATNYETGADQIAAFSQRDASLLDTFAPGARFNGANATGGIRTMQGTSQAAAFVSGAAALAQQIAQETLGRGLTTGEFSSLLRETGDLILDGDDEVDNVVNTGLQYPRLNFERLAARIATLGEPQTGGNAGEGGSGDGQIIQAAAGVHTVSLAAGGTIGNLAFGNFEKLSLGGTVFDDANGNGSLDGEAGLAGWTVFLDADSNGQLDAGEISVQTGAGGSWQFTGIGPGSHRVGVLGAAGWASTSASFHAVSAQSGLDVAGLDFGFNLAPTVADDGFNGDEDQTLFGNVSGNDSDADGPAYTAQVVDGPAHGALTLNANGSFSYTPTENYHGADSFTYRVSDGFSLSGIATVSLSLASVNDAPVAVDDTANVVRNGSVVIEVLANDYDVDGDAMTPVQAGGALHGSLVVNADGSITYTPDLGYLGPDSFSYQAYDGDLLSNVAGTTVSVNVLNHAPVAAPEAFAGDEDTAILGSVLGNDIDQDADSLTASLVAGPAHGSLVFNADGSFGYTPDADFNGADSFVYRAFDGQEYSAETTVGLTVNPVNDAPTADGVPLQQVLEGQGLSLAITGHDIDGDTLHYSLLQGPAGASVDFDSGVFQWAAADGPASHTVGVRVSDGVADSFFDVFFDIEVANVAPTLSLTGNPTALGGTSFRLNLGAQDPGADTISQWLINWGDGQSETVNGNPAFVDHVYGRAGGHFNIQASATDEDGSYDADPFSLTVQTNYLSVSSLTPTATGFAIRFDAAFDPATINLYSAADTPMGSPDVTLTRPGGQAVKGSLVADADLSGFTFISTGGPLATGHYAISVGSGDNAFHDLLGALDGNADGTAGDAYVGGFDVVAPAAVTVGVADFMRGPGQAVNLPANAAGLPVYINSAGGVNSVSFSIAYNPALLHVTDVSLAAGLPPGATLTGDLSQPGIVQITVSSATALSAGKINLVRLTADVPTSAAYGAKEIINITGVTANGLAGRDDDGLHLVGYFGDASGNADYNSLDVQRLLRVISKSDTGFSAYATVDPVIVADITGDGALSSLDSARLQNRVIGRTDPAIPVRPNVGAITFSGPDPKVWVEAGQTVALGETVVVPVKLDTAEGLESVKLVLNYDANALQLLDVKRGDLTADFALFFDNSRPGVVDVDMSRRSQMDGGAGDLLLLSFKAVGSAGGTVALDLADAWLNEGRLTLNVQPQPGADASDSYLAVAAPAPAGATGAWDTTKTLPPTDKAARQQQALPRIDLAGRLEDLWPEGVAGQNGADWNKAAAKPKPRQAWQNKFAAGTGSAAGQGANPNSQIRLEVPKR